MSVMFCGPLVMPLNFSTAQFFQAFHSSKSFLYSVFNKDIIYYFYLMLELDDKIMSISEHSDRNR